MAEPLKILNDIPVRPWKRSVKVNIHKDSEESRMVKDLLENVEDIEFEEVKPEPRKKAKRPKEFRIPW